MKSMAASEEIKVNKVKRPIAAVKNMISLLLANIAANEKHANTARVAKNAVGSIFGLTKLAKWIRLPNERPFRAAKQTKARSFVLGTVSDLVVCAPEWAA